MHLLQRQIYIQFVGVNGIVNTLFRITCSQYLTFKYAKITLLRFLSQMHTYFNNLLYIHVNMYTKACALCQ